MNEIEEIKKALNEYKLLSELDDAASEARKKVLINFLIENKTGHESELEQQMDKWLDEIEEDVKKSKAEGLECNIYR